MQASEAAQGAPTADRLAAFRYLIRLAGEAPDLTLILLDADGEPYAWGGPGLREELRFASLPRTGIAHHASYTAVTLMAIAPLTAERRSWRVVAGRSLAYHRLPFGAAARDRHRWAIDSPPAGSTQVLEVAVEGLPTLFVDCAVSVEAGDSRSAEGRLLSRGWAFWWVGLLLLMAVGWLRRVSGERRARQWPLLATWSAAAVALAALGWPVAPESACLLALGCWLAVAGWWGSRRDSRTGATALLGALAPALLGAVCWASQRHFGALDLAGDFLGNADVMVRRLGLCLAILGALTWAAGRGGLGERRRWLWLAATLLTLAACGHDLTLLAWPLVCLAALAVALWLRGVEYRQRIAAAGLLLLLASGLSAVVWECTYRQEFRHLAGDELLQLLLPPTEQELEKLRLEAFDFFDLREMKDWVPGAESELDSSDLALQLWRHSPLAERDALSALVIEPLHQDASSFSFGLPLTPGLFYDQTRDWRSRCNVPSVAAWQHPVVYGEHDLNLEGELWGTVRYWLLLRPGFRLPVREVDELSRALLRGEAPCREVDGLPRDLLFAVYAADGRAVASPWEEEPPLELDPRAQPRGVAATPVGRSWYWANADEEAVEVLYLPLLGPLEGLERAATHALGTLIPLALLGLLGLALALPRAAFRAFLSRIWRSYSKRLLLVFTVLLFVPLLALNLVLLNSFEDRLRREQLAKGEAAIASARLYLISYVRGLRVGFDFESAISDELFDWISRIVNHQVSLYWGSTRLASSRPELFTTGLLPERIPGEIYSRLALQGYRVSSRAREAEDASYLELYAPLGTGDEEGLGESLFISVPLLEQQRGVTRELATLRRQAVLVTAALFLALLAVGSRLARSFTRPIRQLVAGTQRIAEGAPALGLAPREEELALLADAIDQMARRIAVGRHALEREKGVMERMVENITSGVVSLDRQGRVLLHNRVAIELLGSKVGKPLAETLAGEARLAAVARFAAEQGKLARRGNIRLTDDDGQDREWALTWVPVPGSDDPAALLVVDDATEVLRSERLEAWVEMARIIAHEIKNPLTPIRLSAEHLREVWRRHPERLDEVFERCTSNILKQVEALRLTASDFSTYSRVPRAELAAGDLREPLQEICDAYADSAREGVTLELQLPAEPVPALFDFRLLGRALRNLLENALRASGDGGVVEVSVEAQQAAVITVRDAGPGVDESALPRIFDPYFSTHDTGTGLGLAITRRIVEEHGGVIEARNWAGGGLEVTITMPLANV